MRIVVSGTHSSGKSTLISDFASVRPHYVRFDDPHESVGDADSAGVGSFVAQFRLACSRLLAEPATSVIAERGPLDFLAYLMAFDALGRGDTSALVQSGLAVARSAMDTVDLLVVLPPETSDVPPDEDRPLRMGMTDALLELVDDADLTGSARVVELAGSPERRLSELLEVLDEGSSPAPI